MWTERLIPSCQPFWPDSGPLCLSLTHTATVTLLGDAMDSLYPLSPPRSFGEALTHSGMVFGDRAFGRYTCLNEVMAGASWDWCHYKKTQPESLLSLSLKKRSNICAHTEMATICKPGREVSPEPDHTGTLVLDFQPPEPRESQFLLSHPDYGVLLSQSELTIPAEETDIWGRVISIKIELL